MWGVLLKACRYDPEAVIDFLMMLMSESDQSHKHKFKELFNKYFNEN